MNKEQLMALGLTEEQANKIVEGFGTMIPKIRFDEVNDAKKQAESDLKDRDNQLTDLKKSTGDNKALQEQITQLQTDNKTASDKYDAEVKALRINTALKLALATDTHDPDLVAGLLDKAKIELDESGNVKSGLDDQIKSLRESKAFLFAEKKEDKPPLFKGAKPPEGNGPKDSDPNDIGSNFAKEANSKGTPASKALNPWG
ncbi:phage scaffolding protein [Paenibacillus macquariensis]|uniref:Phage minor structural protein GP20 n=1 Tax=Paenibacillus macquariensis TaxID=948756 RepID=A0ABY1JXA3_9BACL|nr:phage scaffolding protein [Paenibacillus macquariensis]MEC0089340.1 phage scaffolding protein [Paenibacillus macquariensis]OAB33258.1 hypothetical protein PMSM_14695 [Paenibacillus macquariensis subsp. macquariensis]SIQ93451.1 Phage minor structural protein GP20 [Paenibacillus macquariensis]